MQVGYLPAQRKDGSIVPVKVMYYLVAGQYDQSQRRFNVRIRPYVLADYDSTLPLNPVATNAYRNIIKWLDFRDPSTNGDQVTATIKRGSELTREVIPGFLSVKCRVDDVTQKYPDTQLDTWAPGYYYQDGAPWMIGDDQFIGIHQTADKNETTLTMTCWGIQKNPNNPTIDPDGREVPLRAFVLLDAESTDGPKTDNPRTPENEADPENLSIELVGARGDQKYYPIGGYSSCNDLAVEALRRIGFRGNINKAKGAVSFGTATDGNSFLEFTNPLGRCGEVNSDTANGAIFGPALMAVAPITNADLTQPRQTVKVHMKGAGKQALALGVILGGDTSNADYNNGMPPVFQYSALGFNGGLAQSVAPSARSRRSVDSSQNFLDWTLPRNYNHNYYYYGVRIGLKSKALNDPRTLQVNTNNSNLPMEIRDGESNDGLKSKIIELRQGSDTVARPQPLLLPVADQARGSNYTGTGAEGKYLAGQDAFLLNIESDGAHLNKVPRPTTPLSVTVPCGTAVDSNTYLRGWADFNGNGVFDPEEASTDVATCGPNTGELRSPAEFANVTNEMPWTSTQQVTLQFNYPMHHDLNGKRNVWMRLRAVTADDRAILENNERITVNAYGGHVVQKNPDADAPTDLRSAKGSFALVSSGETEDYLFTITPPPVVNNDAFCMPASTRSFTIDVLANDVDPAGDRVVNPQTLAFTAGQPGVVVSNNGKTAVRAGEGTYTVSNGQVVFTPEQSFATRIAGLRSDSAPLPIKGVDYAVATMDGAEVYHRSLGAKAHVAGTAQFACQVQSQATFWYEKEGQYQWDLSKEVLKGDQGDEYVTSGDVRVMNDAEDHAKVPLTYRLNVTAKENGVTTKAIKGQIAIINPTNSTVVTNSSTGVSLNVTPADSHVVCTFDDPSTVRSLRIPARTSSAITRAFTCRTNVEGVAIPTTGLTITPHIEISEGQTSIPATEADESRTVVHGGNDAVRLLDTLEVGTDGASATNNTDLNNAEVTYNGTTVPLSSITLRGAEVVARHGVEGEQGVGRVTLGMVLPENLRPEVPTYDQGKLNYTNVAQLCAAGAGTCEPVDKIPNPGQPGEPSKVPPAKVTTIVTRQNSVTAPRVTIRKVGGENGNTPLSGSNFALYADDNGSISSQINEGVTPVLTNGQNAEEATEFKTSELTADTPYWLVEVKAPVGHQLLAEPVRFSVSRTGVVTILKGGSDFITVTNSEVAPVITVRDVEVGHLPASGGRGVLISLAVGLSLLGFSTLARRPWRRHK